MPDANREFAGQIIPFAPTNNTAANTARTAAKNKTSKPPMAYYQSLAEAA